MNITINKNFCLYQRKNGTRFLAVKSIHHKINFRSNMEAGSLFILPYYWKLSEMCFIESGDIETQA
ncbi:hypothetical protein [Flavobacterium gawalongense]|uniref:Uncharacterized protein n=1 Tax=Flavobacterium gawalongense TaxID=2594432 RepID=A0A553BD61_9FLAO|nr:hypothetical protein [Flavobacterium gawalongense]TRW98496.1 hypothetical protein FNW33_15920 [Flavobacterium gawalongense]TRX02873.1 hypothetical protein FNW12_15825 [Flavobacterium gawalongense]TRX06193.1 hypothetical protein FNW11_14940 [Flavobacterium gawalongense]TRX06925.1 hypothetical protein FNW10_15300 [Flavobacterium gawalongense]TRX22555.1 hypothetical protein FNW38_15550 [Flavobacterium gawalongense]